MDRDQGFCARIAVKPKVVDSAILHLDMVPVGLAELRKICQNKGVNLSNPFITTISNMIGKVESSGKRCIGATIQMVWAEKEAGWGMTTPWCWSKGRWRR